MLFSQNALVYATEGADPVSGNETVEAPPELPSEQAEQPLEKVPAGEEAVEKPAEEKEAESPVENEEAEPEDAAASGNEAEPDEVLSGEEIEETENEAEPEDAAAASGNTVVDSRISLSGGQIIVSINSTSENLAFADGVTVSASGIKKQVGDLAGFDFDVVSGGSVVLKKDSDYKAQWIFRPEDSEEPFTVEEDDLLSSAGTLTLSINGISTQTISGNVTTITGFSNFISVTASVNEVPKTPLSADEVIVTPSYNRVTVKNGASANIYVDLRSASAVSDNLWTEGLLMEKGATKVFYTYYDGNGEKQSISPSTNLVLFADTDYVYSVSEAQVKKDVTTPSSTGDDPEPPKDGAEINMKAVVDRSKQIIKLTWKPARNLKYKKYDLLRLKEDGETFENVKTGLTKTSYSYPKTDIENAEKPAMFKLVCYDNTDAATEYATVAAPSLLYVEQGYTTQNMEYCFSKLQENEDLSYRLEIAEKKTENGSSEKGKRGFNDIKATEYNSRGVFGIDGYRISKTLSVNVLRDFFSGQDGFEFEAGRQYFCRVKSVFYYHGVKYTSAPSNVVARKAGPSKIYVFDINGMKYKKSAGKAAAKEAAEKENMDNMDKYLTSYFKIGDEPLSSNFFIHRSNEGPDAKSGYVVFFVDRDTNPFKGFELLRSDSQYGTYKKLKLYKTAENNEPVKYSGLYKWKPTNPDLKAMFDDGNFDVYYLQYNNFPPEKTFYYAVRGVYKTGNAQGGFGDGYSCTPELDSVQNVYAFDGTIDKINLYWTFDSCVKQYWIYRKEFTEEEAAGKDPSVFTDIKDYKLIKKVKGKKSGTLKDNPTKPADKDLWDSTSGNLVGDYVKFVDKNNVEEGHTYQYVIVPKYDTKNTDVNYNLDKRSDVAHGMATFAGAKIKNFTAKNYGVNRIILKWNKFKKADAYYFIIRTTKDPRSGEDYWTGMKDWTLHDKGSFIDDTAVVGQKYYYVIFAGSKRSETFSDGAVKAAKSLPLAVTDAKVSRGDSFRKGARVSWTKNARDKDYKVTYIVQARDNSEWYDLKTGLTGNSFTDNSDLSRGISRDYRIISVYDDVKGGVKNAGSYSKPSKIDVNVDRTVLAPGETISVRVYPKNDSGSIASDTRMDEPSTSGGAISVDGGKEEDGGITYTVKANYRGTASVTFRAYDCGWTSGSSSSDLKKTITFTVR